MRRDKVYIIGVAPEGASSLSSSASRLVTSAEIVFSGERLLEAFPSIKAEKIPIKNDLARIARRISANLGLKRMVVLASGDPNFFGIARYLTEKLGKRRVEIVSNISSMQVAFARIKESWDDAALVSVHSRPIEDIVATVRTSHKVGIFTDDKNTPAEIARVLLEHGVGDCRAYVCQDLGSERERTLSTSLSKLTDVESSPLSIMILVRETKESPHPLLGISEKSFSRKKGLITKTEIRAISLAKLGLNECSVLWDIGAGSGAVSIEAASLARKGHVFAIEKDGNCIAHIRRNIRKFGRDNITAVAATAPEALDGLPDPTAIFIGGSGGEMEAILDCACRRLKLGGRIVTNTATLENLQCAVTALKDKGFESEITQVNIARSKAISGLTRLEPLNPIFVITAERKL